ncbi:hypothetical protein C2G38_2200391 [Gigaspora rosea]|uniref:Uncharacterized protein n=1 Tax=Gigaspora rosea TaxID=44941 RepID=A0A397UQQ9_9GLOM|nr:hypothetical protein C2G38_2200391 [Gigaspora rosea]
MTWRKYPSIEYVDNLLPVHGFDNLLATNIKRIRLCLPMWLWKAVATGSYMDLHEYVYKNIKEFLKSNDKDHILVAMEDGTIAIRNRNCTTRFADIAE